MMRCPGYEGAGDENAGDEGAVMRPPVMRAPVTSKALAYGRIYDKGNLASRVYSIACKV